MPSMGPVISVFLGLVCAEAIFALLLRVMLPKLPLSARWRSRVWRWGIALAIVYAMMMLIVMLTMNSEG